MSEERKEQQERQRYIDFDAFLAEKRRQQEPVRVKLFGEEHNLPGSLPAVVPILAVRRAQEGLDTVPDTDVLIIAEALFGRERLDQWMTRLTTDELGELVMQVLALYGDELQERAQAARTLLAAGTGNPGRRTQQKNVRGRRS